MEERRQLAERLEDILVDVIEKDELDSFSKLSVRCLFFDVVIRI